MAATNNKFLNDREINYLTVAAAVEIARSQNLSDQVLEPTSIKNCIAYAYTHAKMGPENKESHMEAGKYAKMAFLLSAVDKETFEMLLGECHNNVAGACNRIETLNYLNHPTLREDAALRALAESARLTDPEAYQVFKEASEKLCDMAVRELFDKRRK